MLEVDVVIPVFNRRRYLRETVLSVLADEGAGQVCVVDDGSTDGSLETISDLPVKTIRGETNRGLSHARNLGLARTNSEWITFFDSDDLLVRGSLAARRAALQARPESPAVGGVLAGEIDENGILQALACPLPPGTPLTLDFFRRGGRYCCGPWLYVFRRSALAEAGGFDENLRLASDSDLLFRLLARGPIEILPIATLFYRRHADNISVFGGGTPRARPRALAESFLVNASHGLSEGALP